MKIINFKKEKMKLLTNEQQKSFQNSKVCCIYKEKLENKYVEDKKYSKVRGYFHYTGKHRGAAYSICNFKYSLPKKTPISFPNGSN